MIRNEKCSICGSDNWHSLDYLRNQEYWYQKEKREEDEPVGFKICRECGFVTYDYVEPELLKKFYEFERPVVSSNNIVTGRRKNGYHRAFLDASNEFRRIINNKDSMFIDVGCAQGELLKLLRSEYCIDNDRLFGTELNSCFLNFGRNEYKLNMDYYYPASILGTPIVQFDFISMYHTLEHFQYPDVELRRAIEHLAPDGIMYISIPYWFDVLQTFDGSLTTNFEDYYHLNHVNVFSFQSFKNMLANEGLEVIQEDDKIYGYTVMVKLGDKKPIVKENWEEIAKRIENEKKAIELVSTNPEEAIKIIIKYPDAYILWSLNKDNMKQFDIQNKILLDGLKICPNDTKLVSQLGKLHFQWDEQTPNKPPYMSNNLKQAEKYFNYMNELKPGNEDSLYFIAMINGKFKKDYDLACRQLEHIYHINPQRWAECFNFIAYFRNEQGKHKRET